MKLCKEYYYTFEDLGMSEPFQKSSVITFLTTLFQLESVEDLSLYQIPSTLTSSDTDIYNELYTLILGRYFDEPILKICKTLCEEPTQDEIDEHMRRWGYKFVSLLNMTYEYYLPLLKFYRGAKENLMDDITATTNNSVKFNDTPQNPNNSEVYEGDNYITNFTKTHGTTSSPMMSKIMRLKEIQDNYKNVLYDWVKEFEKLFYANED